MLVWRFQGSETKPAPRARRMFVYSPRLHATSTCGFTCFPVRTATCSRPKIRADNPPPTTLPSALSPMVPRRAKPKYCYTTITTVASKRCDHVSIQNNHVHDNGKNGLMLHRSCDYATVLNNTAYGNGDAGLALYETSFCEVAGNTFYHNLCKSPPPYRVAMSLCCARSLFRGIYVQSIISQPQLSGNVRYNGETCDTSEYKFVYPSRFTGYRIRFFFVPLTLIASLIAPSLYISPCGHLRHPSLHI